MDFLVDAVVSGTVLGVGIGSSPHEVAEVLGDAFLEDKRRGHLRHDYGLIEFFWFRTNGSRPWTPGGFTIQAHRRGLADLPAALVNRYGAFRAPMPFVDVEAELTHRGYRLSEITTDADTGYRRHRLDSSGTIITVTLSAWDGRLDAGDVWSVNAPHRRPDS